MRTLSGSADLCCVLSAKKLWFSGVFLWAGELCCFVLWVVVFCFWFFFKLLSPGSVTCSHLCPVEMEIHLLCF